MLGALPMTTGLDLHATLAALVDDAEQEWDAERVCAGLASTIRAATWEASVELAALLPVTQGEVLQAVARALRERGRRRP